MKVKILKKTIKQTEAYIIKSLFVSFTESDVYDKIVGHLKAQGCSIEQIEKFCKPNEYNEKISYAFGLDCSHFTFDRVERFGVLDANIILSRNDKGYVNAKIQIIDKKEQINGYEAPEEDVNGWSTEAPKLNENVEVEQLPSDVQVLANLSLDPNVVSDLPF